jgi:hypothetical protein
VGRTIERHHLARTAHSILVADLEGHGNVLSEMHRAALFELVDTFAGYCAGEESGRKAFGLPTGLGKTSALVSFVAALQRLDYRVPVAVAASRVESLCEIKRELVWHGVDEDRIGLKHADQDASEPSTGNDSRIFQLVTHARVRSGSDFDLFGTHEGQPRALMVYDETLLRADTFALRTLDLRMGSGALLPLAEERRDPALQSLCAYLAECSSIIGAALEQLQVAGDVAPCGAAVSLPARDEATLSAWATLLRGHRALLRGYADPLGDFLAVSQEPLRVLRSQQGQGIVSVREAVPLALRNVVVLDASAPIRELARMDPTVTMVESFEPAALKSFENVEVHQLLASGSRTNIEASFTATRKELGAVSREVLDIVRRELEEDPDRCFLIFGFVKRGSLDTLDQLRGDLRRSGMNVDTVTSEGKPRFVFRTWGLHEGTNGMEYCTSVILAGVIHRAHLDIAAAIKGQRGHLAEPTPNELIRHVLDSELAHAVYQAASRGSCRRVINGQAVAMRLHLIHRSPNLRPILDRVMPGARWSFHDPQHLKKAAGEGRAALMLGRLLEHLQQLPEGIQKVSSRAIKQALCLDPSDKKAERAFTDAGHEVALSEHGWILAGRSFVRGAAAYGF